MAKLFAENGFLKFTTDGDDSIDRVVVNDDGDTLYKFISNDDDIIEYKGETDDPEKNPDFEDTKNSGKYYVQFLNSGFMYWIVLKEACTNDDICKSIDELSLTVNSLAESVSSLHIKEDKQTSTIVELSNGLSLIH